MKFYAEYDQKKLEASLKKASARFGDSTNQAVVRWGVQTARQLAVVTQAFGQTGTKKKQVNAIWSSWAKCMDIVTPRTFDLMKSGKMKRREVSPGVWEQIKINLVIDDPAAIDAHVQTQRDKRGRIQTGIRRSKIITTKKAMRAAIKKRLANAGMAKGAWLGAGKEMASKQKGIERINIGKNFFSYAQKHAGLGSSRMRGSLFNSAGILDNSAKHVADGNVLSDRNIYTSLEDALKKTAKWYNKAAKTALDK